MKIVQRANIETAPKYKGIPINAFLECHEKVLELLGSSVEKGSLVMDIGAGNGALSQRILDAGYCFSP